MRDIAAPPALTRTLLNPFYRTVMHERIPWRAQRTLLEIGSRLLPVPAETRVHRLRLGERPAERLTGSGIESGHAAVLYLHGGGYTIGSPTTHRSLTARLADQTAAPVFALDYRLAPEHPFPAALDDATAAFLDLVDQHGFAPDRIAIAGDSAGGGLALATAQRLIAEHGHTPAALGLIAPWTDPNQPPDRNRDLVINKRWSRACAAAYRGDADDRDDIAAGFAPLHGVLHELPPTYVQVDIDELLHRQCVDLVAALRAAGCTVAFTETRELWHVAQLQAAVVAPAAQAVRELSEFLRQAMYPMHRAT